MCAKKTPSTTPTKKLSKDSPAKKFVTATSNNKKTPVASNNEKIAAAMKKSQIAGDLKKNKSRDNSSDKRQGVNSRKSSAVADQAETEKCNKISENSIKEPKKVNNAQKPADKPKLPIKKTKSKIKIPNELKNLAIDGIQKEISSGMKTSICEMVKLKKARHNPNPNNSSNKGKETQDGKKIITVELKSPDEIINGVKVIKKIINTASKISESEAKKNETKKSIDDIEGKKSIDDAKKVDSKKLIDNKKSEAKVVNNDAKKVEIKKPLNDTKKICEKIVNETKKVAEAKKIVDLTKKMEVKKVGEIKGPVETKKSQGEIKKKSEVSPSKKSSPTLPIKTGSKIISPPNQKEKQKIIKKELGNQSSAKSKVNNDEKVPITKYVDNKGKNKVEHAITTTKVSVVVTSGKKPTPKSQTKNKPIEKDPLKISSSSSEESENERDSDKIFKKPAKPKAKPVVRALKIVKRITSIKKSRVASLNAIAKVHCLYENEARVQHYDHSAAKVVKKPPVTSVCNVSSEDDSNDSDEDTKECLVKR